MAVHPARKPAQISPSPNKPHYPPTSKSLAVLALGISSSAGVTAASATRQVDGVKLRSRSVFFFFFFCLHHHNSAITLRSIFFRFRRINTPELSFADVQYYVLDAPSIISRPKLMSYTLLRVSSSWPFGSLDVRNVIARPNQKHINSSMIHINSSSTAR